MPEQCAGDRARDTSLLQHKHRHEKIILKEQPIFGRDRCLLADLHAVGTSKKQRTRHQAQNLPRG